MSYVDAKNLAEEENLDLVEVNSSTEFTICKIMDKGKWEYEKKKSQKAQKTRIHHKAKVVKFRSFIDRHDESTKVKHIHKFLEKGLDVQLIVTLKGREKSDPQKGFVQMNRIIESLGEVKYSPIKKSASDKIVTFNTIVYSKVIADGKDHK